MASSLHGFDSHGDNWQTTKRSIRERCQFMFNNKLLSDITFVIGKNGEKKRIWAHKLLLAISSPVLHAMFYGSMAEQGLEVELSDCEYETFLELLSYIYFDEVEINESNVLGILYLAKKYILPFLAEKCLDFLEQNIDNQNAFTLLSQARHYNEENLEEKCWEIIERETAQAISSDDFLEINHGVITALLSRETLTVEEVDLFKAVKKWSEKECIRMNLPPLPENIRKVLSVALYLVRFPVMTLEEFASDAAVSGILTQDETIAVFLYHGSKGTKKIAKFPCEPRRGIHKVYRCRRFRSHCSDWQCDGTNVDSIRFSVDSDILVTGVGLYGISKPDDTDVPFNVDVELLDSHNDSLATYEGTYFVDGSNDIHDVHFEMPVAIEAHESYIIRALIKGPLSLRGNEGMRELRCERSGVRFWFDVDEASFNGTTTCDGQIPEIIFKIPYKNE
ncbi:BTB/POZ domain-containing protein 6-like [Exaiptasia diaphana]|uniref:BTB domain-containing protein n=1 Tax=Exaiptasia diaphana TaxID=2652724 RepID=A0A913X4J8_EXADI|nr:BTB/POZ domain-containing protein 6-like [Exaiptasia diaphana]